MRTILVILFLGLPLLAFSQVEADLSFDKKTKQIQLVLENKYNDPVLLYPKSDDDPKKGTYYVVTLKDKNGTIIKEKEDYVFQQGLSRNGDFFIEALSSRNYTFNLDTWTKSAYWVEVRLHVEARNTTKKIFYVNKEDMTKVFLWK
jgi:hypothetical protein